MGWGRESREREAAVTSCQAGRQPAASSRELLWLLWLLLGEGVSLLSRDQAAALAADCWLAVGLGEEGVSSGAAAEWRPVSSV